MSELPDLHPDWHPGDGARPDDTVFVSASSTTNQTSNEALEGWRARETAVRTLEEWDMLAELRRTDPVAAQRWIRDAPFHAHRDKLNALERGTLIHEHMESWFPPHPVAPAAPEYLHPLIGHLARWVEDSQFQPVLNEEVVWREPDVSGIGVAGRIDTVGRIMAGVPDEYLGKVGLIDLKTSEEDVTATGRKRRPYPDSVTLQLACYFFATHRAMHKVRTLDKGRTRLYLLSPEERALGVAPPPLDYAAVLYVTPARAELYPVNLTEAHLEAALAAARLYWHKASTAGYLGRSIMESRA